jgi:cytochrome c oxidase subunit 2
VTRTLLSGIFRSCCALAAIFAITGCSGVQSALSPAGRDAERMFTLTVWMSIGAIAIWLAVIALALSLPRLHLRRPTWLIVGGGVIFPVAVLSVLLVAGLAELPRALALAPADQPYIEAVGSQWWWRVRYVTPGQKPIELANELRLPVGRRINVRLTSADVVHSFWIPSLAGKMDMVPGRVNWIALEPTRTGTFRGACAEYCGAAHARMNFVVVVTSGEEFAAWLAHQATEAVEPAAPAAEQGRTAFLERGCVTCHAIRGTPAAGVVGPDLTHVGSRLSIAAGTLPNNEDALRRWVASTDRVKPGVHMPAFAGLPDDALTAIAAYLAELR